MLSLIYHGSPTSELERRVASDFDPRKYQVTTLTSETTLKIEDIRAMRQSLLVASPRPRLVLIPRANTLTLPAQHALLKTLEEPPATTTFVLMLPQAALLLPTIRSRCRLVRVREVSREPSKDSLGLLKEALLAPRGLRVNLADQLAKDRVGALEFLAKLLHSLHTTIATSSPRQQLLLAELSRTCYQAHLALSSNVNTTLAMREFFLSLPRTAPAAKMP